MRGVCPAAALEEWRKEPALVGEGRHEKEWLVGPFDLLICNSDAICPAFFEIVYIRYKIKMLLKLLAETRTVPDPP